MDAKPRSCWVFHLIVIRWARFCASRPGRSWWPMTPACSRAPRRPRSPPARARRPAARRGLRVEEQVGHDWRHAGANLDAGAEVAAVGGQAARTCSRPTRSSTPSMSGTGRRRRSRGSTSLARAISLAWPSRPKPVTSVQACTSTAASASAAARFERAHPGHGAFDDAAAGARPNLMAVPTMPVPMGLVRISTSPARAPAFVQMRSGCDGAGHGVAELDLAVAHGVPAEQHDAGAPQRVVSAPEDLGDGGGVDEVLGKPGDRQRGQRPPAHRVDVAQRVRRGDLAVDVRVVDDRREEVHGLHQRRPGLPRVHTGIVSGPEVHQDPRVGLHGDVAQHVSELAGGEFARSTSAAHQLGETLLLGHEGILQGSGQGPGIPALSRRVPRRAEGCIPERAGA